MSVIETVQYPGSPHGLLCVYAVAGQSCMERPAPWVRAAEVSDDGTCMEPGWSGDAWCDEHRPGVESEGRKTA